MFTNVFLVSMYVSSAFNLVLFSIFFNPNLVYLVLIYLSLLNYYFLMPAHILMRKEKRQIG